MTTFPPKLGRYQIVKHLANGGMAQVLLARATGIEGFERHVVVKRIHTSRGEDPVFVKMFLDEARLAAQLHHNNIVQVHDIGKEKGEYFFAMEYVHGEDLRKLLMKVNKKKEKVPFEHVVTIVTTAALALHHAHEQRGADRKPLGLVHRDVSPANILVGYDGNVKVVDFGIAKAAMRSTPDSTKTGALKGKVSYMSPEQCAGQTVDRRSDVFSLGIVLFELSTVRRLFKGTNDFLTMTAIVQGNIPKPSSYRPDIPPELEGIIVKALALDPAERYQSADEMREALEVFAANKGLRTSTGALASYMKQLFGQRPEPWLADEAAPELELGVDFDGQEAGAAKVPDDLAAVPNLVEPTPSSPLARARMKASTASNPPVAADAKPGEAATLERVDATPAVAIPPLVPKDPVLPAASDTKPPPPKDDGWTHGQPTTGSGTPLAWPADVTAATATSKKKTLLAIGGAVIIATSALLFVLSRGGDDDGAPAAAPPPAAVKMVVEPPPAPPVAEPPPVVEPPPPIVEPPPVAEPVVEANVEPDAGSAAPRKKKITKKKKKEEWNPDELFLPESP